MDAKLQVIANSGNRVIYLDLLRIISAFAVVMLHVSVKGHWWDSFFGTEWLIRDMYNSCVRWCVPVFVMISGALFLDKSKELNIKRLYTKNFIHILQTFILWSVIYTVVNINLYPNVHSFIYSVVSGHFHLWFLKMLLGIYIIIPILKTIVSNKQAEKYFIYVSLITCFIFPMLLFAIGFVNNDIKILIDKWYNTMNIKIALGYSGYFVLGHYLNNYTLSTRFRNLIYLLGSLSFICVIIFTYIYSACILGKTSEFFMENLTPFTLFESLTLFLFIKQQSNSIPTKYHSSIIHLARMSFGVYLVHPLVMFLFSKIGIDSSTFHPSFFIPCFTLFVFVVSYLITRILYNIPYLNKLVK